MKAAIRYLFSYGLLLFAPMYVVAQDGITRTPSGRPDFNGNYDISSLFLLKISYYTKVWI